MNKKTIIAIISSFALISIIFLTVFLNKKAYATPAFHECNIQITIGGRNISEFAITYNNATAKSGAQTLAEYIESLSGCKLPVKLHAANLPKISVYVSKDAYTGISADDGNIFISACSEASLKSTVTAFINTYLGIAFAGTEKEHVTALGKISIPGNILSGENAWISEREPIICLWKTDTPRGQFFNPDTNPASEILAYTDDQLYDYVRMIAQCGFTGIQATDFCAAWAQWGGYEYVHDRLRYMADAAHSLNMNFTLWVWGAEFTGYGWADDTVVYHDYENFAYGYESRKVLDTFKKYYSIYAQLADCSDRVIMHFDDPSNTHDVNEVAHYAALFRDMVRAVNPDINFGVSDYTDKYNKAVLKEILGDDFTVYSGAPTFENTDTIGFRTVSRDNNISYGVWSWNLIEMEIDQLAEMNVNTAVIKHVYERAQSEDWVWKPTYWSEMDSYHFANIFSLYSAGQLLINPALEADELLYETALKTVGENNAHTLTQLLEIVEDARGGQVFDEFRWGTDSYLLTSDSYPYESIIARCEKYLPMLDAMIESCDFDTTISLPGDVTTLLDILRTHLTQIYEFATFRANLADLNKAFENGTDLDTLSKKLSEIYTPVPTYDAVTGVFGQPEAIAQWNLLCAFTAKTGADLPHCEAYDSLRKNYIYSEMVTYQQNSRERLLFSPDGSPIWALVMGEDTAKELVDELVNEGLLLRADDENNVYLPNLQ